VFQLGRTAFMLWAVRSDRTLYRNFVRIALWYVLSAVVWIAGGLVEGDLRLRLWLLAVLIDCIAPAVTFWVPTMGRGDTHEWNIEGGHMAERVGLFVMIALGESILVTGVAFAALSWTLPVVAAMAVALVQAIAMWWIYFGQHAEAASRAISASDDPGRIARLAYTYVPIVMVAGIVASAVGDELVLAHPQGHVETATALVLIGGPALFLLGSALFKLSVFGTWSVARFGGAAVTVALFPIAQTLSPLLLSAATTIIVGAVATWEVAWLARHPEARADHAAGSRGQSH